MGAIVLETVEERLGEYLHGTARGMVFCTTTDQMNQYLEAWREHFLERDIRVHRYRAGLDESDRTLELENFAADTPGIALMVCTTAAGAGLDFVNLYCIVHIGYPYTLPNFLQELDRADRKHLGKPTLSSPAIRRYGIARGTSTRRPRRSRGCVTARRMKS